MESLIKIISFYNYYYYPTICNRDNLVFSFLMQPVDKPPKATPASKLTAKASTSDSSSNLPDSVPEIPVQRAKTKSPKKTVTPTKEEKRIKKESPNMKKAPKKSVGDDVPDEVPPSLEKKKSNYRNFIVRDGPRALGSKAIPEVRLQFKVQGLFSTC